MPDRALIIAVEDYSSVTDGFTEKKLTGTLDAARRFQEWLTAKWKAENKKGVIQFCSEPPIEGGTRADSASIIEALIRLESEGKDRTDNLFVYFSGHGLRLKEEKQKLADVLVAADFKDVKRSTASCFKLDALIDGLRSSLGRGCHFYFIDACRNEVPKAISSDIMPFNRQGAEEPSVFVLQSTVPGAPALVGGPFATKLIEGLNGKGKAKVWVPPASDSMKVRFDSLRAYIQEAVKKTQPVTQSITGEMGEAEAVLAVIKPVTPNELTVTVKTTMPEVKGELRITDFKGANPTTQRIDATGAVIKLRPDDYKVSLEIDSAEVTPAGAVDVSLYDNAEVVFSAGPPPPAMPAGGGPINLDRPIAREIGGLPSIRIKGFESIDEDLDAADAKPAPQREPAGERSTSSAPWSGRAANESIAAKLPSDERGVDFSEALYGAVADPDLALWLAILGGGRILGSTGDYSKIGPLPMQDFSKEKKGASPVYILAGFNNAATKLRVGHGPGARPTKWTKAATPRGMPGVCEAVLRPRPGQFFVTLAVGDQPAYTLTSCAMPNRCTLIVLTLGDEDQPYVSQYLLPIGHLVGHLDASVRDMIAERNQLKDVQVLALLARAFRKRRNLKSAVDLKTEAGLSDRNDLQNYQLDRLLGSKWLDPIGACLAMYECVRRGNRRWLGTVAGNMIHYFRDLPDTRAFAAMAGLRHKFPRTTVPLFLDGLRALPADKVDLPFSAGMLDYSGPWTAWRGAVTVPASRENVRRKAKLMEQTATPAGRTVSNPSERKMDSSGATKPPQRTSFRQMIERDLTSSPTTLDLQDEKPRPAQASSCA